MAIEWAGSSPELLLPLDRDAPDTLRSQLECGLRDAICHGRLRAGERLPSSRELARQLGVSRGLVQECYGQLVAEGYLCTRTGSATRVAPVRALGDGGTGARHPAVPSGEPGLRVDFAAGVPDLASFPRGDWSWALREAVRGAPNAVLGYGDPRGSEVLRDVLAGHLRRVRAAAAEPEQLVVCGGFAQGLNIVLRVLASRGIRRVAFEDPGYGDEAVRAAVRRAGVRAVPIPVDEDGLDVAALDASGVRAVVVTPAHQWPTGVVLAPARRRALADWACERDALVVEDEYDAEFRYDRDPVGSVQGLAPGRVAALGTVSKSLAPGIRLGWILCPPALVRDVAEEKRFDDRGSPVQDQLALAALIESGRYGRHLRRMRPLYAARRAALLDALARHAPGVRLTGLDAGFHAVAHLPEGVAERRVIEEARRRSVGVYGMSGYRASGAAEPARLVLGFGALGPRAIEDGVAAVADLLAC